MHDFTGQQQSLYTHTGQAIPMGTGIGVTQWCSTSLIQYVVSSSENSLLLKKLRVEQRSALSYHVSRYCICFWDIPEQLKLHWRYWEWISDLKSSLSFCCADNIQASLSQGQQFVLGQLNWLWPCATHVFILSLLPEANKECFTSCTLILNTDNYKMAVTRPEWAS